MKKNPYAYKTENLTKEELERDYAELHSVTKVGEKHNVCGDTMLYLFQRLGIPYAPKKLCVCRDDLFSTDTETSFYLAGFIAADGCISETHSSRALHIGLAEADMKHLLLLRESSWIRCES